MDAQQLIEFVVDGAPTVVTQVFLPHLYFLSPLILICIDATTTHYSGDLDVSAVTLTFICKMLRHYSQYHHAQDRRQRIRNISNMIKVH